MSPYSQQQKTIVFVAFALLCVCAGFVYYSYFSPNGIRARQHSDVRQISEGEAVRYVTLVGDSFDMRAYEGRILIVNSWASWSPFTPQEHQLLASLKSEFGDSVTIIAMNRMETKETANAYLESIGRQNGIEYVLDETDHYFDTTKGYAMPETIVYDSYGRIVLHTRGTQNLDEIRTVIQGLIKNE